jgi:hypothetical protein
MLKKIRESVITILSAQAEQAPDLVRNSLRKLIADLQAADQKEAQRLLGDSRIQKFLTIP